MKQLSKPRTMYQSLRELHICIIISTFLIEILKSIHLILLWDCKIVITWDKDTLIQTHWFWTNLFQSKKHHANLTMAKIILGLPFQESISNNIHQVDNESDFLDTLKTRIHAIFFVILITAIKDISFVDINFLFKFMTIHLFWLLIQCRKL